MNVLGIDYSRNRTRSRPNEGMHSSSILTQLSRLGSILFSSWTLIRGNKRKHQIYPHIEELRSFEISYDDYLQSPYWKYARQEILDKLGDHCDVCHSKFRLQVHHRTYDHIGEELNYLGDMRVLCHHCHRRVHMWRDSFNRLYVFVKRVYTLAYKAMGFIMKATTNIYKKAINFLHREKEIIRHKEATDRSWEKASS